MCTWSCKEQYVRYYPVGPLKCLMSSKMQRGVPKLQNKSHKSSNSQQPLIIEYPLPHMHTPVCLYMWGASQEWQELSIESKVPTCLALLWISRVEVVQGGDGAGRSWGYLEFWFWKEGGKTQSGWGMFFLWHPDLEGLMTKMKWIVLLAIKKNKH